MKGLWGVFGKGGQGSVDMKGQALHLLVNINKTPKYDPYWTTVTSAGNCMTVIQMLLFIGCLVNYAVCHSKGRNLRDHLPFLMHTVLKYEEVCVLVRATLTFKIVNLDIHCHLLEISGH